MLAFTSKVTACIRVVKFDMFKLHKQERDVEITHLFLLTEFSLIGYSNRIDSRICVLFDELHKTHFGVNLNRE